MKKVAASEFVKEIEAGSVKMYIVHARNQLPGIDVFNKKHTVFVSWSGAAMLGSLITQRMNNFWSVALGLKPQKRVINPSIMRKFTTTVVHQQRKEMEQETADHLCHSLDVARKNYRCVDKQQNAAAAVKAFKVSKEMAKKPAELT